MARKSVSLPHLILASASPRRFELLSRLPISFSVITSDASEVHNEQFTAREVCRVNAFRKARTVARQNPDDLVLGADTLVTLNSRLFGKPSNLAESRRMLAQLQGQTHEVITGVCLMHWRSHTVRTFTETTRVTFKNLSAADIRKYVSRVETLDKAGAYAIQEFGEMLVDHVDGSYDNVVGLPTESLQRALKNWPGLAAAP